MYTFGPEQSRLHGRFGPSCHVNRRVKSSVQSLLQHHACDMRASARHSLSNLLLRLAKICFRACALDLSKAFHTWDAL